MATLSLKVGLVGTSVVKTMQFDPSTIVYDACKIIREKIAESNEGNPADYGLFLADEDPKKGVWLESGRTLEYYLLRNGDLLEYKKKQRVLRVRTLDGSVKTLHVDDSHTVGQLMITICTKIGITNHDEYSLVQDIPDEEREKTLTLRRDKSIAKDQKKLDEMKKKLHTDDELNWLDHSKTLREQGIDVLETLLLRRKFFFSDQNVDARDPVQLNLLYVQTRDAILKGAHPVSPDEALLFAGVQCQIQFGDHVESKHKAGFLDLKEFLPKEYAKGKGIEKKIYAEHKKLAGLAEIDGKVKYTQVARSLKTYGITFFLVKEKMKGKNKLQPRLLGITKDSVVRVDAKTKEIIKTYPLTTVKRWAASPNSFTLDFGDYSDSYYSTQTMEGEQISQLIAGYIDIILKKKKAKDHLGIDGDEESTMYEDSVSPFKATTIRQQSSKVGHANMGSVALPAVLRAGESAQNQFTTGSMQKAQFSQVSDQAHAGGQLSMAGQNAQMHGLGQAQRGLLGSINSSLSAVTDAQNGLVQKAELPQLGSDPASHQWKEQTRDLSRQKVGSQLSAMNAATAQVVTLTSGGPDDTDYTAVGSAVQTISSNIGEFSRDMRMLAALEEDGTDGDKLLDAARRLAGAFSDLLKAAQPGSQEPRQNLLNAASKIGEAGHDIMVKVEDETEADSAFQDTLMALAKAVANTTAALVLKAKGVAGQCENQTDQNSVIGSATQCALATSQLVACTKVVAPTIHNPSCQEQLVEAAKHVAKNVDSVADTAQGVCKDDKTLQDLGGAATDVSKALDNLLHHIRTGANGSREVQQMDTILLASDRLFSSMGDTPEMVKHARILAQATSQLVNALKCDAETHDDSEQQKKLMAAAKLLADATARMVEAAKGCASAPEDEHQQMALKAAAEELRSATSQTSAGALKRQIFNKLQLAARNVASAGTQLINASSGSGASNRNQASHQQLMAQNRVVSDESIPKLVQGLKATVQNPDSPAAQMVLINASQDILQPGGKLVTSAKAAVPTVGDQAAAMSLSNASQNLASALMELRSALSKAQEACGSLEIDGALDQVHSLERDIDMIRASARNGQLAALPGETAEISAIQLGATSKTVGSSMAQLLTAAAQGNDNYTGIGARETANALRVLTNAIRGVAATTDDQALQDAILECAADVMEKSANLIEEAKKAVANPQNPENQTRLAQVAKAVSQALNNCVNCLPGLRDVDQAVRYITTISMKLSSPQDHPQSNRSIQEVQENLNFRAASLNKAAGDIVTASAGPPQGVAHSSNRFSHAYEDFVDTGLEMTTVTKNVETKTQIISNLRSVSMVSSKLLMATKSLLADPNAPNAKNQLTQAARAVTDSINSLINECTVSAPGQKECDNALRQMQMMRPLLDDPSEPVNDSSYFESLDGVVDKAKILAYSMTGISNHAKQNQIDDFCESVRNFADAICGIVENAAHSAYLVGIADPNSEPGRSGLVDQSHFARANQAILMACQSLTNPASTQQQDFRAMVLSAATVVAKHTSALCNTCRMASQRTGNPVAKRHFVQSAKDVANNTANLVRAIKVLDSHFNEDNRARCAEAAKPLLQAVDELSAFASSPEFASVPAKISPMARKAQGPIVQSTQAILEGACSMVLSAKQLAVNPRDHHVYQNYSTHSHSVSEGLKHLVGSIKDSAPGQKECDRAIEQVDQCMHELDRASLAAVSQSLHPRTDNSLQAFQENLLNSARQILELIEPLRSAARNQPEKVGHLVNAIANYMEPLIDGSTGAASKTVNSRQQMAILDQTKTVAESALQMLIAAKEAGGNPKNGPAQQALDENVDGTKECLTELLQTIEEAASSAGHMNSLIDSISKSIARAEERCPSRDGSTFVDHQTNIVQLAKQIARGSQEMLSKVHSNSMSDLGHLAQSLTRDYALLSDEVRGAVATSSNPEIANRLLRSVQDLGHTCLDLVRDAGHLQASPQDSFARSDLNEHTHKVKEKVSQVLAALQAGARGTQACIHAASTVSGIIGDLDTTIMFATAGTLNADGDEAFSDHRENILRTAKSLVEDTKTLVAGAASNQEQLASAASSAVMTITQLSDCVKQGAASLGSEQPEAQVLLINAVKDVASALGELISATKNASGKTAQDPTMGVLKDSAKVMVTNVTSLLKTVKTVEDEAARGTRALESSIEAIQQEMNTYKSTDRVEKSISAEELIRFTKPITIATAKAVAAGNSCRQEDVIVAANMGRKAISDLLKACKAAAAGSDNPDLKRRVVEVGASCSLAYRDLLEHINNVIVAPTPENKLRLAQLSKHVAANVSELVQAGEALKGMDYMDPSDPTIIAETELLSAASSIEAAAKKLSSLQPRRQHSGPKEANENLNFEEQILVAARSIAAATAALVKAASAAQRELVMQGRIGMGSSDTDEDSQWSEGLISAARMVAAATHSLCDAANSMVQGQASEEKLISSAKQVASSTAQLLVACKVKADMGSQAMRRLQAAGNAVKRATEALVKEAQSYKDNLNGDDVDLNVSDKLVGGLAQIIMAQEDILVKEKELESARRKLETIRKAKYKDRPLDYESGSDF